MHKRPLFVVAIFFIFGIVIGKFLPDSVKFLHILIVTVSFILLSFIFSCRGRLNVPYNEGRIANILLLLSVTSFAALLYVNSNIYPANHISYFLGEEKIKGDIVGVIRSPALTRKPYFGKIGSTYLFEVEDVNVGNGRDRFNVRGLAQIRIQTEREYGYGDRLLVRGTIKRPRGMDSRFRGNDKSRGNNRFNYREYLERQKIFALINAKEKNVTVLEQNYKSNPILKYTYLIREKLKNQIIEKMPLESGAFLRAILLGDRSELPKHIQTSFKNSGTMHVLAISGLHIGIIGVLILYLLRYLRFKREISYIGTMIFLIFFAVITLSRPSVVRAVVMMSVFLIGMLLGRKVDVYNSLGVASLFILIRNPKDLFNVGFQLSFLAVLSIVFLVPRFMRLIGEKRNRYVRKYFYMPLAVSVSAWLGTFPLILHYFRMVAPISIISNLFILPVLLILLVVGVGFLLLGWMPFIGAFLAGFNNLLAKTIFFLADFFGSLRFGHFNLD